CQHYYSNPCSF
nr:immunoglobulin light chain junction region [Macaca mulatta]